LTSEVIRKLGCVVEHNPSLTLHCSIGIYVTTLVGTCESHRSHRVVAKAHTYILEVPGRIGSRRETLDLRENLHDFRGRRFSVFSWVCPDSAVVHCIPTLR